jgi:Protein of unknown function (DUF3644)
VGSSKKSKGSEEHKLAREMYRRYQAGESKSSLEVEYWNNASSHGKKFSSFIRAQLGIETEGVSPQTQEIRRLQGILRRSGIRYDPVEDLTTEDRLLAKTREAALSAIRLYNDPSAGFRTDGFTVLMIIAWNSLLQAILERNGVDYTEVDQAGHPIIVDGRPKILGTWELIKLALEGEDDRAIRVNLDFFLKLRHHVEHRYLPAVDIMVVEESQALLLNLETVLTREFGEDAGLGEQLIVPLQLSALRPDAQMSSLRKLQSQVPGDVLAFLQSHRSNVPEDVLENPQYALPIFLVPVTANRERSADAIVRFVPPGEVPEDVEKSLRKVNVVVKRRQVAVASKDLMRPGVVVEQVRAKIPYRFTSDTHTRAWRHYGVRPPGSAADPTATNPTYCVWDQLSGGYGYTKAWVKFLIKELSDADKYRSAIGRDPEPRQ